jgi:hypothetical protein
MFTNKLKVSEFNKVTQEAESTNIDTWKQTWLNIIDSLFMKTILILGDILVLAFNRWTGVYWGTLHPASASQARPD